MITKELEYAINKHYFNSSKLTTTGLTRGSVVSHEVDVAVVTKSDYIIEFELKVSKSDLLAEKKKKHSHRCNKIRETYFVMPDEMKDCVELVPEEFGVILVRKSSWRDSFMKKVPVRKTMYVCNKVRKAKINKEAEKVTQEEYITLCRLASMRYWTCKLNELKKDGHIIFERVEEDGK